MRVGITERGGQERKRYWSERTMTKTGSKETEDDDCHENNS